MERTFALLFSILFTLSCHGNPISRNTLEEAGFFEGDMNLSDVQLRNIFVNANAGLIDERFRWPRNMATGLTSVPFIIRNGYSSNQQNVIRLAMTEIERSTCIRFVPRTNQNDFIEIFNGNGCWAQVGRVGGRQQISLGFSNRGTCVTNGIVIHELLHALGIYHMQSSPNRDMFVRINYENIMSGAEHNFMRYDSNFVALFNTNYDFDSIMHYARDAFSRNGRDTITTFNASNQNRIGNRFRMSQGDITRIQNMYACS